MKIRLGGKYETASGQVVLITRRLSGVWETWAGIVGFREQWFGEDGNYYYDGSFSVLNLVREHK